MKLGFKRATGLLAVAAVVAMASVGVASAQPKGKKSYTIGLVAKSQDNPVFVAARTGAEDEAKELGKKYVDEPKLWIKTEDMVRSAMKKSGIEFVEVPNEAAFYGPKIDVEVWSAIGREFTLATNQVDFDVPGKLGLKYIDTDGSEKVPI